MFTDPAQIGGDILKYTSDIYDCNITNKFDLSTTTYWCPPVIKRNTGKSRPANIQSSRVSSFSYLHKMLLSSVYTNDVSYLKFMIYDNTKQFNLLSDKLFAMYPGNSTSNFCLPQQYCSSEAIGACISNQLDGEQGPCSQDCSWNAVGVATACNNYNSFIYSINAKHEKIVNKAYITNNELIIKSWNYNPNSSMRGRGIEKINGKWVAQTPNPKSPWGWNDVSNLSKNEHIPLLAFGITIPDASNPSLNDISNIKHLYAELSNNLEPSFNEYRRKNLIPLMPYHIGLDVSCLTRQDCSNPFFDLSFILHHS